MSLEKIQSEELKRQVTLRARKLSFKDVTEEDLDRISEITLNAKSFDGEKTNIELSVLEIFKNLKKVRLIGFDITKEGIDEISKLEHLEMLEFVKCKVEDVSFELLQEKLERIYFSECGELLFKYPKVRNIIVNMCRVDFRNVDLEEVQAIHIINSVIKNLPDLSKYLNLKKVNFDGSKIIDESGMEVVDISVPEKIEYSHKKSIEKIDRKDEISEKTSVDTKDNENSLIL